MKLLSGISGRSAGYSSICLSAILGNLDGNVLTVEYYPATMREYSSAVLPENSEFGGGGLRGVQSLRLYRARRDQGWLLVGMAAAVLVVGLGFGLLRGNPDDAVGVCCFPPFAALVSLIGVGHLRTRVEVGPDRLVKRSILGGFTLDWSTVECWSVVDLRREDSDDTLSHYAVRLVVGWRRYEVRESDVHQPGFEAFVADVRTWIAGRERAEPG